MGKFKSGISGNPTGRPKGAQNLVTIQVKEVMAGIVKQHLTPAKIARDLKKLEPKERLEILAKLATFVIPRPTESNVRLDWEGLAPEKVNKIYSLIFEENGTE